MTQEEKQLLLKDLCARLPYGVKINVHGEEDVLLELAIDASWINASYDIENVKPYLRPMSSMTEEEHKEFDCACLDNLALPKVRGFYLDRYISSDHLHVDWLNAHHFDYRGLIEKGLALEAPEGMYES